MLRRSINWNFPIACLSHGRDALIHRTLCLSIERSALHLSLQLICLNSMSSVHLTKCRRRRPLKIESVTRIVYGNIWARLLRSVRYRCVSCIKQSKYHPISWCDSRAHFSSRIAVVAPISISYKASVMLQRSRSTRFALTIAMHCCIKPYDGIINHWPNNSSSADRT